MSKPFFLLGFVALAAFAAPARADVATEARYFDEAGRRAYAAGQYEKALESFQLVQEIAPSQGQLYNIALCADLAGRGDMAFSLYSEYLKTQDPDAARRSEAEGRSARLKVKLALVEVTSDPPGAAVYVDRRELGKFGVTPLTLAVPDGEHHLLVEQDGFLTADVPVAAKTGTVSQVTTRLTPEYGRLVVNVTPGFASVRFLRDGVEMPATREHSGYRLQVGSYRVLATAPGYSAVESRVVVRENATAQLDLGLAALPRPTGSLLVSAAGVPAEVFIDGRRVAVAPATLREIPVGLHTLELRLGTHTVRRSVTVSQGRPTLVDIELAAPAP